MWWLPYSKFGRLLKCNYNSRTFNLTEVVSLFVSPQLSLSYQTSFVAMLWDGLYLISCIFVWSYILAFFLVETHWVFIAKMLSLVRFKLLLSQRRGSIWSYFNYVPHNACNSLNSFIILDSPPPCPIPPPRYSLSSCHFCSEWC